MCITRCQRGTEGDFTASSTSSVRAAGDETGKHFKLRHYPSVIPAQAGISPPLLRLRSATPFGVAQDEAQHEWEAAGPDRKAQCA